MFFIKFKTLSCFIGTHHELLANYRICVLPLLALQKCHIAPKSSIPLFLQKFFFYLYLYQVAYFIINTKFNTISNQFHLIK